MEVLLRESCVLKEEIVNIEEFDPKGEVVVGHHNAFLDKHDETENGNNWTDQLPKGLCSLVYIQNFPAQTELKLHQTRAQH